MEEGRFRLWAFHIFYQRTFRLVRDPLLRFVKALLASTRPIQNAGLLAVWRNRQGRILL